MLLTKSNCFSLAFVVSICTLSMLYGCKTPAKDTMTTTTSGFEKQWKQLDSIQQLNQPKTALELVKRIRQKAQQTDRKGDLVRAIIAQSELEGALSEDGILRTCHVLEEVVDQFDPATNAILKSWLAEAYHRYAMDNIWRLPATEQDGQADDVVDMSRSQLVNLIDETYLASLHMADLIDVDLSQYRQVIHVDKEPPFWTKLMDLLMHRAVRYYSEARPSLPIQLDALPMDDEAFLGPLDTFLALQIPESGEDKSQTISLLLFQQILNNHRDDEDPSVLIDWDLRRLSHANKASTLRNRDLLYLQSLQALQKQYAKHPANSQITAAIQGKLMQKDDGSDPALLKKIHEECTHAIKRFPSSYGADLCRHIIGRIEEKSLRATVEETILPNQHALVLVNYRNLGKLYVKSVKLPADENKRLALNDRRNDHLISALLRQPSVFDQQVECPSSEDYRPHSTEFIIPPLEKGYYAMLVSSTPDFTMDSSAVTVNHFTVSRLALAEMNWINQRTLLCVDRKTGTPLEGVEVSWYQREDHSRPANFQRKGRTTTDHDGKAEIPNLDKVRGSYSLKLTKGQDESWIDNLYFYPVTTSQQSRYRLQMYTDRSIYRPGQTVFFKGIALENDGDRKPSILKSRQVSMTLYDANGTQVSTSSHRTNEFGSIAGSFQLPREGLKGHYSLGSDLSGHRHTFRVEAYKRPKFYVTLKAPTGDIMLGDSVAMKGKSVSFAGVDIASAQVRYRVIKRAMLPYYYHSYHSRIWPNMDIPDQEIANGTTISGSDGSFSFSFLTLREKEKQSWFEPRYQYRVVAEVTDLNGETQSDEMSLKVGQQPFQINMGVEEIMHRDSFRSLAISATNFAGVPVPVQGVVKIHRLAGPANWRRPRLWPFPDHSQMDSTELRSLLPMYKHEPTDPQNWKVLEQVLEQTYEETSNGVIEWKEKIPTGHYRISVQAFNGQNSVTDQTYIKIYHPQEDFVPAEELLFLPTASQTVEPGKEALIHLASPVDGRLFWQVERKGVLEEGNWLQVEGWSKISIPIREEDRGGVTIHLILAHENRISAKQVHIRVPWTNKKLVVNYRNLRDKTKPGAKEILQVNISGAQSDPLWAELLVGMYDASLDQFVSHQWQRSFHPIFGTKARLQSFSFGANHARLYARHWHSFHSAPQQRYPSLESLQGRMWFARKLGMPMEVSEDAMLSQSSVVANSAEESEVALSDKEDRPSTRGKVIPARDNFRETAFFFPQLKTDKFGNLVFEFEMNDALTTWRIMSLAHTANVQVGYHESTIISQKELMITSNSPRFLRAGDTFRFSAKVDNLTEISQQVEAMLVLKDALDDTQLDMFVLDDQVQSVTLLPGGSQELSWSVQIPADHLRPIEYTIQATSGVHSDAERDVWPILQNRRLITESVVMTVPAGQERTGRLEGLLNNRSSTLEHTNLVVDVVPNPSWYAIQAMPYIIEYPHESAEQMFNRYLIHELAGKILSAHPDLDQTFERWRLTGQSQGQLAVHELLKSAKLAETPWVQAKESEEAKLAKLASLLEKNTLGYEKKRNLSKLKDRQKADGGFSWFPGGRSNTYITQYIVEGFGYLKSWNVSFSAETQALINAAINFLDGRAFQWYQDQQERLRKRQIKREDDHLSSIIIHYLYVRSAFLDIPIGNDHRKMWQFYLATAREHWMTKSLLEQAMLTFLLHRQDDPSTVALLIKSFREQLLMDAHQGPHWKYTQGYLWSQAPVETHVLLMQVFTEVESDPALVEQLKVWLINQKRTRRWESTKSTAAAIRALTMGKSDWLDHAADPMVLIGGRTVEPSLPGSARSSLYIRRQIPAEDIRAKDGAVAIKNNGSQVVWGSAYWQYLENIDKVAHSSGTPLSIQRHMLVERLDDQGRFLVQVDKEALRVGDKVIVQLILTAEQDMEFIHVQDQRASAFEPLDVLSEYHWRNGLGYYQSTSDTGTDIFIDFLPRGRYVIQYALRVSQRGDFSHGIGTIQSMYAPAFGAHTEGLRLSIDDVP